jgi:hypothetical protein
MTDRDENFNKILRKWEVDGPSSGLDRRVWSSVRAEQSAMRAKRTRKWLPMAAGLFLVVAAAAIISMHSGSNPRASNTANELREARIETTAHAEGFVPLPQGSITVVSGRKER